MGRSELCSRERKTDHRPFASHPLLERNSDTRQDWQQITHAETTSRTLHQPSLVGARKRYASEQAGRSHTKGASVLLL